MMRSKGKQARRSDSFGWERGQAGLAKQKVRRADGGGRRNIRRSEARVKEVAAEDLDEDRSRTCFDGVLGRGLLAGGCVICLLEHAAVTPMTQCVVLCLMRVASARACMSSTERGRGVTPSNAYALMCGWKRGRAIRCFFGV
jgi:enoyl-CoA hydratase/carnithine racemase